MAKKKRSKMKAGQRRERQPWKPTAKAKALREHALTLEEEAELQVLMGQRVHEVRLELGLTQNELGYAFGRSQPWARDVESGRQWPPHWLLAGLSEAAGKPLAWFYERG